jgi:hypothetical protein
MWQRRLSGIDMWVSSGEICECTYIYIHGCVYFVSAGNVSGRKPPRKGFKNTDWTDPFAIWTDLFAIWTDPFAIWTDPCAIWTDPFAIYTKTFPWYPSVPKSLCWNEVDTAIYIYIHLFFLLLLLLLLPGFTDRVVYSLNELLQAVQSKKAGKFETSASRIVILPY